MVSVSASFFHTTPSFAAPNFAAPIDGDVGYNNGLFIKTKDNRFAMTFNGFAQARFSAFMADRVTPFYNFDLALGRLAVSGHVFDPAINYFFQYEGSTFGNSNAVSMLDWWISYTASKELTIGMGRIILPFSRQFYTHPGNLLFTDLSAADYAFNLQRSLGLQVNGNLGFMSYHLMLMNSTRALDGGPTQVNIGNDIGWLARVEVPILEPYGYMESVPNYTGKTQLSVGAAAAANPVNSQSGFQNTRPGDRTLNITADAGFRTGGLSVQGAFHVRQSSLAGGATTWSDNGYYAQIGFYLAQNLELGARLSTVNFASRPNGNLNPVQTQNEYTGGINYYLRGHGAKIQLDYSLLNNTAFGASASATSHRVRLQTQILF